MGRRDRVIRRYDVLYEHNFVLRRNMVCSNYSIPRPDLNGNYNHLMYTSRISPIRLYEEGRWDRNDCYYTTWPWRISR